jgi:iron only hydrogenase large subunit-like protein
LGFDEVYEVAKAAEIVSKATKKLINNEKPKLPLISSACPAVVRLIQVRLKLESPMEVAANIARDKAMKRENLSKEDVGVFFITPCAAKMTSVMAPYERESSSVSGVISIRDIYLPVLNNLMKQKKVESLGAAGFEGIRWANSGGESLALGTDSFLAVDGIHEVITILEEVENDKLEDVIFMEALACKGGCLGGPLTIENCYVAKTKLKKHIDEAKEKAISNMDQDDIYDNIDWTGNVKYKPVLKLDDDMEIAMKKLESLQQIENELPGLDCGACGAPSCRALAEDIVRGMANETDCLFKLRDRVRSLANQMMELEAIMPPVMDKESNNKAQDEEN